MVHNVHCESRYEKIFFFKFTIGTRHDLFMPHVNNKDTDQPAHLGSLFSVLVIRSVDSILSTVAIS